MKQENSRREALQQMGLIAAGMCFLPLASCTKSDTAEAAETQNPKLPAPAPFLVTAKPRLEAGPMGGNIRTIVRSAQTNGQFSCIEAVLSPKKIAGSPHKHENLDELMYVLEGTASVLLEDKVVEVPAGSWHLRPRGLAHVVWNSGREELRLIDMYFNQNFEDYLEQLYHQIFPEVARRNISFEEPEIAKRIEALNKQFGLTYYPERQQAIVEKYGLS